MTEIVSYEGWHNCIRLFNNEIELIVTTDIGPRIVRLGYHNGQNFFHLVSDRLAAVEGTEWRIYGGHRLWLAPESIPWSYAPDNDRVGFSIRHDSVILNQEREEITGLVKSMEIMLAADRNEVTVIHRVVNMNASAVELALWPISVLQPGGNIIVPHEPHGEGNDYLLPARPLVLWQYTKMNDPRWTWGGKYILARHDAQLTTEQKIGVLNKQGWAAYLLHGELLIKKFGFDANATYTDFGCNNEVYINDRFIELETLSPITKLAPGQEVTHAERWMLSRSNASATEESIDEHVLPLISEFSRKQVL